MGGRRQSVLIIGAAGLVVLLLLAMLTVRPEFPEFVDHAGVNVPSDNVFLDYAKGIAWSAVLGATIFLWPVSLRDRMSLLVMWTVKCLVMLGVMLPYEEHYTGLDCWGYFIGAHSVGTDFLPALLKGGSDFVVSLGALYLKVAPDSYHAMKTTFGYGGLAAIYLLYRASVGLTRLDRPWMFWALGLYPSVLFWSSILGKDPVVLLGISLHIWALVRVICYGEHKHLLTAIGGLGLAGVVRVWMGPIMLIPALLLFALKIHHIGWRITTVSCVAVMLGVLAPVTASRLEVDPTTDLFASTQSFTRGWDKANSAMHPDVELNSLTDLIRFTPQSFFAAYFRPLPGDLPHLFGWIAGCEDLVLLILATLALFKVRRHHWRNHFFLWGATLLLTWGLAYSLVTYKDLGTAVRFRLQIMPVLLGMVWFLLSRPFLTWEAARNAGRR
jgi:hypothetical protein